MTKLKLSKIRIDGGTQPREDIDIETVDEYVEAMKEGDKFPPVVVFNDGAKYWLADGFHRYHASNKIGYLEIEAEVHSGTLRDAILYSVSANAKHGLRRTNEDKRKAVLTLLNDEEWSQWSDREIARQAEVSKSFVNKLRNDATVHNGQSGKRKGADGRTIDTSNIGTRSGKSNSSYDDADDGQTIATDLPDNVDPDTGEVFEEKEYVHRNTKIPEDQKELCPCCGQVLPDEMQIQPDRRR